MSYLREMWPLANSGRYPTFNDLGLRCAPEEGSILTYAGFVYNNSRLGRVSKFFGLPETLPDSSEAFDKIIDQIPPKKPINRFFRIVKSEALR